MSFQRDNGNPVSPTDKELLRSARRPYVVAMSVAFLIAFATSGLASYTTLTRTLGDLLRPVGLLFPTSVLISNSTSNPDVSAIILLSQWPFLGIYVLLGFLKMPPWSPLIKRIAIAKGKTLTRARTIYVIIGTMCGMGVWLLGDCKVIDFPTLLNGRLAYPPAEAIPQLRLIYGSRTVLMFYAWLSPLVEALFIYSFVYLLINAKSIISAANAGRLAD